MTAHTVTVLGTINAKPESVFALATNINALTTHYSAIKSAELLTSGEIGVGTRWRETRVMFGREATEELFYTAFDPPTSFVVSCESHGARYDTTFRFRPYLEGTRVDIEFSATATTIPAKIMSILLGWMMTGSVRKCLEADLADLKKAAEAGST